MKKISSAIHDLLNSNDFLTFGIQNGLLNLSKTAEYLRPYLEVRAKKEIKASAILMSLSRISRETIAVKNRIECAVLPAINFSVRSNLCAYTYLNTSAFRLQLNDLYIDLRGHKGYFTQSQGINEYSIIFDEASKLLVNKNIKEKPRKRKDGLISFNIQIPDEAYEEVGILAKMLQKISFQGINVYEVSTTFGEMIFYVDQKDLKLTVETLHSLNELRLDNKTQEDLED